MDSTPAPATALVARPKVTVASAVGSTPPPSNSSTMVASVAAGSDRPSDRRAQLEQLLAACEAGDAARVTRLLSADGAPEVDAASEDGTTPLQVASASGCEETVRVLLMRGAALDSANHLGWTPLLHACRHGHTGVAALLLQRGASPRARTRLGVDALVMAVRGGHTQTARLLLDAGASSSGGSGGAVAGGSVAAGAGGMAGNGTGPGADAPACELSALAVAALTGHDPLLRLLTDRGWDAGERASVTGITPLMCSAMNGHTVTAQALVERGADPNVEDTNGKTALQLAIEQGKREVRSFLDRKTTNKSRSGSEVTKLDIIEAAKRGDMLRIREILEESDNQKDFCLPQDGITPLMYAAMSGRIDIAMLLVEHDCDMNKQDSVNEWSALMYAVYYGKKSMVKYLVGAGADVSLPERSGMTPFDMATFKDDGDKELLRLLVVKTTRSNSLQPRKDVPKSSDGEQNDRTQGLKALWSRVSNGFKNLKLSTVRTLNLPSTRPNTLADAVNTSPSKNRIVKSKVNKTGSQDDAAATFDRVSRATFSAPSLHEAKKKSMSMYSLVNSSMTSSGANDLATKGKKSSKPQPDVGPFAPLPNFDTISGYMPSKKPKPASAADLTASPRHPLTKTNSPRRSIFPPDEDGSVAAGGGGGGNGVVASIPVIVESPPSCNSPSPDSSGGASSISTLFSAPGSSGSGGRASSATSSTLTPGGGGGGHHHLHHYDRFPKRSSGSVGEPPRPLSLHNLLNQPARRSSLHQVGPPAQAAYNWSSSSSPGGSILSAALQSSPSSSSSSGVSARPVTSVLGSAHTGAAVHLQQPFDTSPAARGTPVSTPSFSANQGRIASDSFKAASEAPAKVSAPEQFNVSAASVSSAAIDANDPFAAVLKRYSLEHFKDVFDQQEIDLEAFLALSDDDLCELGITDPDSRRQILTAASQLGTAVH